MSVQFDEQSLVGMHLDAAKALLYICNARYRVTRKGKVAFVTTMDYIPHRVNLKVNEFDIVYSVSLG